MGRVYLSPPDICPSDFAAVESVLASNWVAPVGPELDAFERAVAERVGRSRALAVNSGTAALHLALQVLGVGPGDRVICPTLTFAASANPIRYGGAEPVFVDCEWETWNMDPALLEEALDGLEREGRPAKAVIVVQIYGQCASMDRICETCERRGVSIIEDAAEALGASYRGRAAGSFGALSFFSFNGNKIVTTSGGGMLLTDDDALVEQARFLASQARAATLHYEHEAVGYNYRMSNLLAGLGRSQLADLDRRIAIRRGHFEYYREELGAMRGLSFMPLADPDAANYWISCLTVDRELCGLGRDALIEALAVEARPLWKPLHRQPVYQGARCFGGAVAEHLFAGGLCLPSGSGLTAEDRGRVVEILKTCLCSAGSGRSC